MAGRSASCATDPSRPRPWNHSPAWKRLLTLPGRLRPGTPPGIMHRERRWCLRARVRRVVDEPVYWLTDPVRMTGVSLRSRPSARTAICAWRQPVCSQPCVGWTRLGWTSSSHSPYPKKGWAERSWNACAGRQRDRGIRRRRARRKALHHGHQSTREKESSRQEKSVFQKVGRQQRVLAGLRARPRQDARLEGQL